MDSTNHSQCCCCAPYPVIDFTSAFMERREEVAKRCFNETDRSGVRKQVVDACQKYGCFHVKIKQSTLEGEKRLLEENVTKKSMEMIFNEPFLSSHVHNDTAGVSTFLSKEGRILSAKYRGRMTESGGISGLEPKQSWEYFRCCNMLTYASQQSTTEEMKRLEILRDYTRILHEVAVCTFSTILNFPPGSFIDESKCECHDNSKCYCSIDLLRAFKYDALLDGLETNLGSSPHTDWGSLTVVWQDSTGGLQIYCHEHERWNEVEAPVDNGGEEYVRLFIHVGDFTSLANCNFNSNKTKDKIWQSPLHRVVCPSKVDSRERSPDHEDNDARYSLVYFAYPPPGVSLEDARSSLFKNESIHIPIAPKTKIPFERFMVLKNQSLGAAQNLTEEETYQNIKRDPFNAVIEKKWKQVQRETG